MDQSPEDERMPLLTDKPGTEVTPAKPDPNMDINNDPITDPEETSLRGRKLCVVICILMTELCERLTYYSVVANLVLFCTSKLELTSNDASTITYVFTGTVYILSLFGGYISDSFAGKFNTIFGSGLIYVIGLSLLPVAALDFSDWYGKGTKYNLDTSSRKIFFFIGLTFVALGTGGIKANVGPYGAQQVQDLGPAVVQSFFNWFYWFINAGSFVAYSGVAYIQQNISFSIGFLVPLISMIVALVIFVTARSMYIDTPPGESILMTSIRICGSTKCQGFDRSRKQNGGQFSDELVDGVIAVMRTLPVFLLIILYWAVYSQMQSTFFLQSERMDVTVGTIKMPVAVLNIFNTVIILVLIPIMDRGIYPLLAKFGFKPSHLQRIGFGMILATLSVVVAGILEIYRKKNLSETGGHEQVLSGDSFNASTLSVFLQVPQFALVGASEVFASITGLEFAYSQAPDIMQGVVMGMFLMTSGVGSYVSQLIISIVGAATKSDPWFPDEINEGKVENLFFLIGGLMFLDFLLFLVVAKHYVYRKQECTVNYSANNESVQITTRFYNDDLVQQKYPCDEVVCVADNQITDN